jgi:hypothetical protein
VEKKETTKKKAKIKLLDLTPKKNPQGGGFSYFKKPSFPIPPPGFISSSGNGKPERNR